MRAGHVAQIFGRGFPGLCRKHLVRKVLPDLPAIVLLDDFLALRLEGIHGGKNADLHKNKHRDTGGEIPYGVPVSSAPFQRLRLGQDFPELLSFRLFPKSVLECANRLRVGPHQKIQPAWLGLNE